METIEALLCAWSQAEARGDTAALEPLLDAGFRGDGPMGFVLDKERWLDRYRLGELTTTAFAWVPTGVRMIYHTAVVTGIQSQVARYRGQDCSGAFPCSLVAIWRDGRWTIVNLQIGHLVDVPCARPRDPGSRRRSTPTAEPRPAGARTLEGETAMSDTADVASNNPQQPPRPDPTLRKLDRFVGRWEMKGRTLGSDVDDVHGYTTFEWLPGGFFLQQRTKITFAGYEVEGLEVIGYDHETGTFPSTVYPSLYGTPIPYRWEVNGDELTITTEMIGATFRGRWSEDGTSFSGGWRPNPGREGPGNVAYDIWGGRAQPEAQAEEESR
jgi:hypothetical protein